jgi:hypothetical protein
MEHKMAVSADDIRTLLTELEQGDPLDFGDIPLQEESARQLVVLSMAKFSGDLEQEGLPAEAREALALATCARVLLDNLLLNYRVMTQSGTAAPNAHDLLMAIAGGRPRKDT